MAKTKVLSKQSLPNLAFVQSWNPEHRGIRIEFNQPKHRLPSSTFSAIAHNQDCVNASTFVPRELLEIIPGFVRRSRLLCC